MNRPITLKIDVTKIDKAHLFVGKKGTYLDVVIWPNKDGAGQYGDTHYCVQEISKEKREAGGRGPIIGNAKVPGDGMQPSAPARAASPKKKPTEPDATDLSDDSLPF